MYSIMLAINRENRFFSMGNKLLNCSKVQAKHAFHCRVRHMYVSKLHHDLKLQKLHKVSMANGASGITLRKFSLAP